MTDFAILEEFTFTDQLSVEIPLTDKEVYAKYKIAVTDFSVSQDATIQMVWGQNAKTKIPTYVTDVTWEPNQGEGGKRVTNAIDERIDLIGMPLESDLPHQAIFLMDAELSQDGQLVVSWESAYCKREGAFYASKGKAYTAYSRINNIRITPSISAKMSGKIKLLGYK